MISGRRFGEHSRRRVARDARDTEGRSPVSYPIGRPYRGRCRELWIANTSERTDDGRVFDTLQQGSVSGQPYWLAMATNLCILPRGMAETALRRGQGIEGSGVAGYS